MNNSLKEWISKTFINPKTNQLIRKRLADSYIKNLEGASKWMQQIYNATEFLIDVPLSQRLFHIMHDKYEISKCNLKSCNNNTRFIGYLNGYVKACSNKCAQLNPDVRSATKQSCITKYGVSHPLGLEEIQTKSKETCLRKYGVENISQNQQIKDKKRATCFSNFGVDHPQQSVVIRTKSINSCINKYGVDNVQKNSNINHKTISTRTGKFYDQLYSSNRLDGKVIPMFSKQEYIDGICSNLQNFKFKCTACSTCFTDSLEDGDIPRCTTCYKGTSQFEHDVVAFIRELNVVDPIICNDKKILNGKELDIYIPSKNIAIECNGNYWHSELCGKDKNYHLNKTKKCEELGIRLIHIFEDEWKYKENIVKLKLQHILGYNTHKIYARQCTIRVVDSITSNMFLDTYHLQGSINSSIIYGAYYNDELVAIMTFCKRRLALGIKNGNKDEYELLRFATSKLVVGIGSKLLSHFITVHMPSKIISYADKRWTSQITNVYTSIGFKFIGQSPPNYWYLYKKNITRQHRFAYRKDQLRKKLETFDPTLSEWGNMKNNNFNRIWDCGNLKYEMRFF